MPRKINLTETKANKKQMKRKESSTQHKLQTKEKGTQKNTQNTQNQL